MPLPLEIPQRKSLDGSLPSLVEMRDTTETQPGIDESDLIRKAQKGNSEAFEWLYQRHVKRIYALCLRMVSDPLRAEELTQDVFVRLWKSLGSFRHESAFTTWMHRLAVNVVVSDMRSTKRRDSRVLHTDTLQDFEREVDMDLSGSHGDTEGNLAASTRPTRARQRAATLGRPEMVATTKGFSRIEKVSISIDRAVQISPTTTDLDVGLVQIPGDSSLAATSGTQILTDHRCKSKLPGPHGLVADFESTLQEKLCHIAETELISQPPENREQDDVSRELEVIER